MTPTNQNKMNIWLEMIKERPEIGVFFEKLHYERDYSRLFFIQNYQLLHGEKNIFWDYLYYNNINEIINYLEQEKLLHYKDLSHSVLETRFELAQKEFDSDISLTSYLKTNKETLLDIVIYILIQSIRKNPELKKLVKSKRFSYKQMKKELKDYSKIEERLISILKKQFEALDKNLTKSDKLIKDKIEKFVKGFITGIVKNVGEVHSAISTASQQFISLHSNGIEKLEEVLTQSELESEDYYKIISEMVSLKLLQSTHTIFWCERCKDEIVLLETHSKLHPTHAKLRCVKCSWPLHMSTLYKLDSFLFKVITQRDGLLSVYIGQMLQQEGFDFKTFHQKKEDSFEKDFIVNIGNKNILIESKMFRTDKDLRAKKENIKEAIIQIKKHSSEINSLKASFIIHNLVDEELYGMLQEIKNESKFKTIFEDINLTIYDYEEINELIEKIQDYHNK